METIFSTGTVGYIAEMSVAESFSHRKKIWCKMQTAEEMNKKQNGCSKNVFLTARGRKMQYGRKINKNEILFRLPKGNVIYLYRGKHFIVHREEGDAADENHLSICLALIFDVRESRYNLRRNRAWIFCRVLSVPYVCTMSLYLKRVIKNMETESACWYTEQHSC